MNYDNTSYEELERRLFQSGYCANQDEVRLLLRFIQDLGDELEFTQSKAKNDERYFEDRDTEAYRFEAENESLRNTVKDLKKLNEAQYNEINHLKDNLRYLNLDNIQADLNKLRSEIFDLKAENTKNINRAFITEESLRKTISMLQKSNAELQEKLNFWAILNKPPEQFR